MSERWKLGNYEFVINPNRYGEQFDIVGDNVVTLNGTLISQPTSVQESYHLTSVFFQNRPRVLSEVSIGKGEGIEYVNNKFYILDKDQMVVNVYNSNLSILEKTITIIDMPNGEDLTSFDVQTDETIWVTQKSIPNVIIHKVSGATKTSAEATGILGDVVGIKYLNGYIWVTTNSSRLYKLNPSDMSIINYANLPNIPFSELGYQGMTSYDNYLIISYSDGNTSGVYYIDSENGNICNNFYLPDYKEFKDVTYNGKQFVFLINNDNVIRYTTGNTVLLDIYILEKQIKNYGFISMIDDMEVENRVAINNYSIDRQDGNLHKYNISISATRVDRGVI